MLQIKANRGTERPSSVMTPESLKQDQLAYKCLCQVEQQRELTQDTFNYLLKLLKDEFPPKVHILCSSEVGAKAFAFTVSDFVAPLYHPKTECWSVICVSIQNQSNENRGRPLVKVQQYNRNPQQWRHSNVAEKMRSWAEERHGKDVEFRYIHAEGPAVSHKNPTGIYAIMGALDLGTYQAVRSKDKLWSGDSVKAIKAALQGTQPRYPTPGGTPGRRESPICSTGNGAEGMETPSRTPKDERRNSWKDTRIDQSGAFRTQTPTPGNCKRRRVDSADPMAFDVKEKLDDATAFISSLKLPPVTALLQEFDECRKKRDEHNKIVEKKKVELEKCQNERASRAKEHGIIDTELTNLGADIAADEKANNEYLSTIPTPTMTLNFPMSKTPQDSWREDFEENIKPQRKKHEQLGARKRKASEMLQSAEEVCTTREEEVKQAKDERRVIEEDVKKAYMREEFVAMEKRHVEEHQALLLRFEGDNWEEEFDKRRGKM